MSKPRILICDDEVRREQRWKDQLVALPFVADAFDVDTARPREGAEGETSPLPAIIGALERRRLRARLQQAAKSDAAAAEVNPEDADLRATAEAARERLSTDDLDDEAADDFDDADILVIDYDLLDLGGEAEASHLTGERVAYLARCYSKCGLIVALNQFANDDPTFDLNLTGHARSYADLNIASGDLCNPGLWTADRDRWTSFRPWRWPVLPLALGDFLERVEELVQDGLDRPVFEALEIPVSVALSMPRSMLDFLAPGPAGDDDAKVDELTFADLALTSGVGYKHKDYPVDDAAAARVAAARLAHWLDRVVLPPQDVLVDAPHLAPRYPSVFTGAPTEGASPEEAAPAWTTTARFAPFDDLPIDDEPFRAHRFADPRWLSRPAWYWSGVSASETIPEVQRPWEAKRPEVVFAEDSSQFIAKGDAQEFVADVNSPFARRYVERIEGVKYRPSVRFAL